MSYTLAYTGAEIDALLGKIDAIFVAEYGSTIYSEVTAAIAAGNKVIVANAGKVYVYAGQDDNSGYVFTQSGPNAAKPNATYVTLSTGNVWSTATVDLATLQQFYASLMEDTASGSIASFPDGAEGVPVKELTAEIEPIQDLHGQASPWPPAGGKNKLVPNLTSTTINGVTFTVLEDKTIVANGTATGVTQLMNPNSGFTTLSAGSYVLSGCPTGGGDNTYSLRPMYAGGGFGNDDKGSGVTLTFAEETSIYIDIIIRAGQTCNNLVFKPMICKADAPNPDYAHYEPYSNICPISGFTGAEIPVTGKNLYNKNGTGDGFVADKALLVDNTLDTNQYFSVSEYIKIKPSTAYTLQHLLGNAAALCFYDANKGYISGSIYGGETTKTITSPATAAYIRFSAPVANADTIQLEEGSSATAYEPFGTVYSVSWSDEAGTVYGGHFVVNEDGSVDLTVAWGGDDMSNLPWAYITSGSNPFFRAAVSGIAEGAIGVVKAKTSIFKPYNSQAITGTSTAAGYVPDNAITVGSGGYAGNVIAKDYAITSVEDFITAVTGQTIIYELATPQTYHLDSIGQITTLLGQNNIWSNTGDISVKYRCNTALYIEKKLGGNVQTLSTPRLIGVSPSEGAFDVISGNPINIERVPLSEINAPELDELTEEPELEPYDEPEAEEPEEEHPEAEAEAEAEEPTEEPEAPEEA